LKPASLKALPKSLSFGKSTWQVVQDVPYWRENAGIAKLLAVNTNSVSSKRLSKNMMLRERIGIAS
jgi:hypothetical protein